MTYFGHILKALIGPHEGILIYAANAKNGKIKYKWLNKKLLNSVLVGYEELLK